MRVLGLGFTDHDASAALAVDGVIAVSIARERISRLKRDGKSWGSMRLDLTSAIRYCLSPQALSLDDIDLVVWSHVDHLPVSLVLETLKDERGMDLSKLPILALPHHFAHAVSAVCSSPFHEAAVLVVDGSGGPLRRIMDHCGGPEPEMLRTLKSGLHIWGASGLDEAREQESFYSYDAGRWQLLRKNAGDWNGLGAVYASASKVLFGDFLHAGKTMGLASYLSRGPQRVFLHEHRYAGLSSFFSHHSELRIKLEEEIESVVTGSDCWSHTAPPLPEYAALVQAEIEEAMLAYAKWLRHASNHRNLCLAGGVALNCVANTRIALESGFENVFVPPAPGDDGIAIGCALYGSSPCNYRGKVSNFPAYTGRVHYPKADWHTAEDLRPVSINDPKHLWVASKLAGGSVIAWYQGGSEIGPRALGHRSILADPRRPEMREFLNRVVKKREAFRPFAPVVLDQYVDEFFDSRLPSTFMSFVANVRVEKRPFVPAITHIDGSARYQVLREQDNNELYQLLDAFRLCTGIPMLLNTSLNRDGEPIVETPEQAARCMLASSVDYLVVDGAVYERPSRIGG